MRLTLVVNNPSALEGGTKATYVFDESGGIIGAAPQSDWVLADRQNTVADAHARIFFCDDQFCLQPLSTNMKINGSAVEHRNQEPFQLLDGDSLTIGRFELGAYVTLTVKEDTQSSHGERWAKRFVSVETLLNPQDSEQGINVLDAALMRKDGRITMQERLAAKQENDPVSMLQASNRGQKQNILDPVSAFDLEKSAETSSLDSKLSDYLSVTPDGTSEILMPDDLQPTSSYFAPLTIERAKSDPQQYANKNVKPTSMQRSEMPKGKPMSSVRPKVNIHTPSDEYLADLERGITNRHENKVSDVDARTTQDVFLRDSWLSSDHHNLEEGELVDHVVLRPLCHAMGLPIRDMSGPVANQFAQDVGKALTAAVTGLMALNQRELSSRTLMADTHLHAIEDNPLRLARDTNEAVYDLFLNRSPVHLSASAAIEENLSLLGHHQEASDHAVDAALESVLKALAPVALARRFVKYKGHAPRAGDLDAWHWAMYQHYYAELSSDRQGGLSRMFREVFRQVYDREMRSRTAGV